MQPLPYPTSADIQSVDYSAEPRHVLADLYSVYFPEAISTELQQLRTPEVLTTGYRALVEQGIMTETQWVVWTASQFTGGISNGGVWDGLLGNQPELVADCVPLLARIGLEETAKRFQNVFAPLLLVLTRHASHVQKGEVFSSERFWQDSEAAEAAIDEDAVDAFEQDFLGEFGSSALTLETTILTAAISWVRDEQLLN